MLLINKLSIDSPQKSDIPKIAKLQLDHFRYSNDRTLNWRTSQDELEIYLDLETSVIARNEDDGNIIAYLLNVDSENAFNFQSKKSGLSLFSSLTFDERSLCDFKVCVGQIFVSKEFRGMNVGSKLYQYFLKNELLCHKYDLRVGTVAFTNFPSLRFHNNHLDMDIIGVTGTSLKDCYILILDLKKI